MAYNGSEYLVALQRGTRFGFVRALMNKRSETIKDAMIDMQLLLQGVWRFHSDEGREFTGAVDDWLREHTVLHTTTGASDPNANSLVQESVGARKHGIRCLLHQANAPVCLWPDAAEHANEIYNHSKGTMPGQNDVVEPMVLERRAPFRDKLNVTCCQERETKFAASLGLSGVCAKIETSHSAPRKSGSHRFARNFCSLEQKGAARHQNCNFPR